MPEHTAEIGVFGGSGFYSLLEEYEEIKLETPYGAPSDLVAIGNIEMCIRDSLCAIRDRCRADGAV